MLAAWDRRAKQLPKRPARQVVVEFVDIRHATAHDRHNGIESTDHRCEPPRHAVDIAAPEQPRKVITPALQVDDFGGLEFDAPLFGVLRLESAA